MNKFERPHPQGPLGLSRRDFMAVGGTGVAGYALTKRFEPMEVLAAERPDTLNTATACIFIKMPGAPSHLDTFGCKPGNGQPPDYNDVEKNGIILFENLFPKLLYEQSQHLAIANNVQGTVPVHPLGQYMNDTAHPFNASLKGEIPALGAVAAYEYQSRRQEGDVLPGFFMLSGNSQAGNGFLNGLAAPFPVDPVQGRLVPPGGVAALTHPRGDDGFDELMRVIRNIDSVNRGEDPPWGKTLSDFDNYYTSAKEMYFDPAVKEAFTYDNAERALYGNTVFGDACLVAKNLLALEKGCHFVQIALGSWDHHGQIYAANNLPRLSKIFDDGLSQLIKVLSETRAKDGKTLLEKTLIVWMGEFGRTPGNLNGRAGRDHFANTQFCGFSGGGTKGGRMIGRVSPDGRTIQDPEWRGRGRLLHGTQDGPNVRMEDIATTIYSALDIDWTKILANTPSRRRFEYVPTRYSLEIRELFDK